MLVGAATYGGSIFMNAAFLQVLHDALKQTMMVLNYYYMFSYTKRRAGEKLKKHRLNVYNYYDDTKLS